MRSRLMGALSLLVAVHVANAAATDSERKRGTGVMFLPAVFYTPETGFGGGGGLLVTIPRQVTPEGDWPQTLAFLAIHTEKNQPSIVISPQWFFGPGTWLARGELGYKKFPTSIYGIGNDTPDEAEEKYTFEGGSFAGQLLRRLAGPMRGGLGFYVMKAAILDHETGGLVARRLEQGLERGWSIGGGPVLEWDSRDRLFGPRRGAWVQATARRSFPGLGSDFEYESYTLDLRRYHAVGARTVLALQALGTTRSGKFPLGEYPTLGAVMRGIVEGRYQDRWMAAGQAEIRFPLHRRLTAVAFAALGEVADRAGRFSSGGLKYAGGCGVRFLISPDEGANVRLDVGFGEDGAQVYFQFDEAF